jgi:hypothetical protein
MKPLLDLLLTQPGLLADHALAYTQLASQEAAVFSKVCRRRLVLTASALCCASLACGLAGVSCMLWYVSALAPGVFPWPLVLTPMLPALVGIWCLLQLKAANAQPQFEKLRLQWMADQILLNEMRTR